MKRTNLTATWGALALMACLAPAADAAPLFSENFEVDPTANWNVNNNNLGTNAANFFFDYNSVGIPSAPNSSGGSTRGLKIGANLNSATAPTSGIPGISVSPTGESFSGNYKLRFDWWHNYIGPLNVGATGSTMISTYGILTSGTSANLAGASDSVFFAATGDGQSASDYRAYSVERPTSYQVAPPSVNPLDLHNVYTAGSQNSSAALYTATFPAGATAPAAQQSAFPTQTSSTSAGAAGFRWHQVEIEKLGNIVTWKVNGVLLSTLDTTQFIPPLGGSNILFGHSDTNSSTNSNAANLQALQFTLIDNVEVVPEPSSVALCSLAAIGLAVAARRRK